MSLPANPYTITFRDLLKWGWSSLGHCGTCHASYPANIGKMAALPMGDRPIVLRFNRGRYACGVCHNPLSGITILGKTRRDGMRQLVEVGECPQDDPEARAAAAQGVLL